MAESTYAICNSCLKVNRVPLAAPAGKSPVCGSCKRELAYHDGVTELSGTDSLTAFASKSPVPVVVDFWAKWCGPCRSFAPVFREAAGAMAGTVAFAKVDTEISPEASSMYGIRGIPSILLFANGKEIARRSGALPLGDFLGWLRASLPRQAA